MSVQVEGPCPNPTHTNAHTHTHTHTSTHIWWNLPQSYTHTHKLTHTHAHIHIFDDCISPRAFHSIHTHTLSLFLSLSHTHTHALTHTYVLTHTYKLVKMRQTPYLYMGWLPLVGSLQLQVSFAKEPYKRDDILQKRPRILRSLLIVATPWVILRRRARN